MPKEMTDHDILTKLVTTTELNHQAILEKIEDVKSDVREVRDGNTLQLAKMDARLMILEAFKETKLIDEKISQWNAASSWVQDFRSRWKWVAAAIGFGATVATYLLDHIGPILQTVKGK